MKIFLKRVLLFFIPLAILAFPVDKILSNGLKHSSSASGEIEVLNDLYGGKINSDIIILGTSHAWVHIDPSIIEERTGLSTYNLGGDAYRFELQYFLFHELLKYNKKPKTIICILDDASFLKSTGTDKKKFLPFMLWNKNMYDVAEKLSQVHFFDYSVPLYRYISEQEAIKDGLKYYVNSDSPFRTKGYKAMHFPWYTALNGTQLSDAQKIRQNRGNTEIEKKLIYLNLFEQFIKESKQLEIDLHFVYIPEYDDNNPSSKAYTDRLITIFDSISVNHNIPFFNYAGDSLSFSIDNYYNYTHLNNKGSRLLSEKLGSDLAKYKLKD